MKKLLWVIVLFICFPFTSALAVKVSSLYQAEIAVASQADDARVQAVKDGLLQVLIKMSGDPAINANPDIKQSLQRADYYVQEFSYSAPTTASSQYLTALA